MRRIPVTTQDGLSLESLGALRDELPSHATLQDVLAWCQTQTPRRDITSVVVQDEYTHDIILQAGENLFLVYDTT